jgi:hypothetical protein
MILSFFLLTFFKLKISGVPQIQVSAIKISNRKTQITMTEIQNPKQIAFDLI